MAKNDNLKDFLTDVADAIRAKKGISGLINPQNFSSEIASIEGGGGSAEDTITYWDITPNAELSEFLLWAYMVKAQTSDGVVVNPIGIYYVQGGATEYVTPLAIALDIKRVVLVENGAIQSLYDVLGTDDLSSFGARRLTRDEFYDTNI